MKVIEIKVQDDFKRGQCYICPFAYKKEGYVGKACFFNKQWQDCMLVVKETKEDNSN